MVKPMRKIFPSQKIKIENEGALARTSSLIRFEDKEALEILVNVESIRFIDLLRKLRWSDSVTSEVLSRFLVKGWISIVEDSEEIKEESVIFANEEKEKNHLQSLLKKYASEGESISLIPVYKPEPIIPELEQEVEQESLISDEIINEEYENIDEEFLFRSIPQTPQMSEDEVKAQADALLKAMGLNSNPIESKRPPLSIPEYGFKKSGENEKVEETTLVSSENIPSSNSPNKRIPTKDLSEAALLRRNNRNKFLEEGKMLNRMRQEAHEKARMIKEKEEINKIKKEEHNKAAKEKQKEDYRDTIFGRAERLRALRLKKEQEKDS